MIDQKKFMILQSCSDVAELKYYPQALYFEAQSKNNLVCGKYDMLRSQP